MEKQKAITTKSFITLVCVFILLILSVCVILALFVAEESIDRFSLLGEWFFGLGSLSISIVALVVSAKSYVKSQQLEKQKICDEASRFIIDHPDLEQTMPLCLMAYIYQRNHRYQRPLYNEFNRLTDDVRSEVLNQLGFHFVVPKNEKWINDTLGRVENFVNENDLGNIPLYDNNKYYSKLFLYCDLAYDEQIENYGFFKDVFHWNRITFDGGEPYSKGISFFDYTESFINAKANNSPLYLAHKDDRPIDALKSCIDFGFCKESEATFWTVVMVDTMVCMMLQKERDEFNDLELSINTTALETYEDRFLSSLAELYNLNLFYETRDSLKK